MTTTPTGPAQRDGIHWGIVRAIAERDLILVRRSKSVLLPIIVVPLILLVLIPAGIGFLTPLAEGADDLDDIQRFLEMMPAPMKAQFDRYDERQVALVFALVYMFAPLYLILPMMTASVIAAGSFAGEKEKGTLEALLYTPATDGELVLGKMLGAWVPALVVGLVGFILYSVVVNVSASQTMGGIFFPNAMWVVLALWMGPAAAALGLGSMVLVSSKVSTFQDAYQLGGIVVIPLVVLVLGQIAGVIYLSAGFVFVAGAVLWVIDSVILWFAIRTFRRSEIIARL